MRKFLFLFVSLAHVAFAERPVTGTLYPHLLTKVSSQVAGRVEEVDVKVGDLVEKGQVLAKLDPAFFEMDYKKQQTAFALAKVFLEEAKLDYDRMKNLWENQQGPSIAKKQLDDASLRLRQKQILFEQAEIDLEYSKKRLQETEIKAPYRGVISKRYVDPGEAVTVMPVVHLFEISDCSKLLFEFSLPQELISKVKPGLYVQIDGIETPILGTIERIYPQVELSNRSFKCRVIIENEALALKPGLFVTAKVETE